jgi:hypothetical protein
MMGGMLTEDFSAIYILALKSLSQDWVKWFVLTSTDIEAAQGKSYNLFESL